MLGEAQVAPALTACPAPGGFGVGLIRPGWAPMAHRAGSPVVPRDALPACHACSPGGFGLARQVWGPVQQRPSPSVHGVGTLRC
jgi:hypothetical protein